MSKKFLDSNGVQHLYSKINKNLQTLANVIDETLNSYEVINIEYNPEYIDTNVAIGQPN